MKLKSIFVLIFIFFRRSQTEHLGDFFGPSLLIPSLHEDRLRNFILFEFFWDPLFGFTLDLLS